MEKENKNLTTYVIGGAVGLLLGLAAIHLLIKNQEKSPEKKLEISNDDRFKVGISLIALLKQIAELGKL
jgi:hypothetical protein